jgi:LmbE family N-acetylglucosaminyl deacetylase
MKRILLIFAHPDDESFSCAGTVAKYIRAGWRVDLVCATRGEAGNCGPYNALSADRLAHIRQKELEKAGTILGISTITFLGYFDGKLQNVNPGNLEDVIFQKMKEDVPDIVITSDTTGISNHPDHIKICYAATFAFQKYASWIRERMSFVKEYKEEYKPKLYYTVVPESVISYLKKKKIIPDTFFGKPVCGTPDKLITTVIDISRYSGIKKKALMSHISQTDDVKRFFSFPPNPFMKQEYFKMRLWGIREIYNGNFDRISIKL